MDKFCLNIAGYVIKVERSAGGPVLMPAQRFRKSFTTGDGFDYLIRVHRGGCSIPPGAERVFNAPLVEERDGQTVIKSHEFWSIHKKDNLIFIKTIFPHNPGMHSGMLTISRHPGVWDLELATDDSIADPLAWPLDGLLLYYLTVFNGDIMIHASGVDYKGKGYIFSGVSGKGKSTMARLWEMAGAKVIHDDRLIIRRKEGEIFFYNTPVYDDDEPRSARPAGIFLLEHGKQNMIVPLDGSRAVSSVMANCIQHNWNSEIISGLMESLSEVCGKIPVSRLYFRPESEIVEFTLGNGQN